MFEIKINRLILLLFLLCDSAMNLCHCIPSAIPGKSWPRMKTFKIWDSETDDYLKSEQNIISVLPNGSGNSTEINDSDMELYVNDYPKRANERDSRGIKFKFNRVFEAKNAIMCFAPHIHNSLMFHLFVLSIIIYGISVLNFFPIPVDDECLSDDGRRYGVCLNVYECRIQGGTSRGECALGFGVCCVCMNSYFSILFFIFYFLIINCLNCMDKDFPLTENLLCFYLLLVLVVSSCGQEVANNLTYIISPNFPALMSSDLKSCKLKIKLLSPDVSQLRFDFLHFSLVSIFFLPYSLCHSLPQQFSYFISPLSHILVSGVMVLCISIISFRSSLRRT